jgi:hypothetical protein
MCVLQFCLQVGQRRNVRFPVLVDPAVVNQPDRHRVEEVQLLAARSASEDETRIFEDAKMLHHAEARHLQLGLELSERAAVTREEPIEEVTPRRISQCPEHAVVVHTKTICDLIVTCQAVCRHSIRARPFCMIVR